MSSNILIVGNELCGSRLETVLSDCTLLNYICVDGPEAADWLMQDGFSCAVLIVDRALFDDPSAAEEWVASNPQAAPILTDKNQMWSAEFHDQLRKVVRRSRAPSLAPQPYGVH